MTREFNVGDEVTVINFHYLPEGVTGFVMGKHMCPAVIKELARDKATIEYFTTYIIDVTSVYLRGEFNQKAIALTCEYLKPKEH
jgi:hypothetical protein